MASTPGAEGGSVATEFPVTALEETILSQPDAISRAITDNLDKLRAASTLVAAARRVRLTGVGASWHAALIGEMLLRSIGIDARATHAYELATYPTNFDPHELLVALSHRGGTSYVAHALRRARQSGLKVVAVTGQGAAIVDAEVIVEAAPRERGTTHTVSFTAAIAVLSAITARCEPRSPIAAALPALPECARAMLASRDTARDVAAVIVNERRLALLLGAGVCHPIARGGALSLKEAAHLAAEGNHLEDGLHGGLHGLNPGDVLIQLSPDGPASERHADLARVADVIGFERWKIGGAADGARWHTSLPDIPEIATAIPAAIPLQWLALECALRSGHNPDVFRRDDERWDRAYAAIDL